MDVQQSYPPSAVPWAADHEVLEVLDAKGHVDPSRDPKLPVEQVRRMYEGMVRTRIVDQRLTRLQRQGRIGFHVGAEGEEAAVVASAAALKPQDWLFPCYREVGAALYRGLPLQTYIDNMYGNANDKALGRQMPDHVTGRDVHFGSVTSPIGTQITQAVGFAWAGKIRRQELVVGVYFGDGATSSNDFHAGMTFAGVYRLPCLFLLRNNGWAISMPVAQQSGARTLADKGAGYGVPAVRCDGNDALAVYVAVRRARERAAAGEGATLLELITYRMGPHSTSDDPTVYRPKEDIERKAQEDPVVRLRRYLEQKQAWSDTEEEALNQRVQEELKLCIERAEAASPPSLASMFEDVYERIPQHLQDQQRECLEGPRARKSH